MLDRVEFLVGEALVSLRRNTWMTFAAITTAGMALFLLGGLALVTIGFSNFVTGLSKRVEMRVFLKESVTETSAKGLQDKILKIPGVSSVRFVPKALGLKEFLDQNPSIDIKGLEIDNPLPDAYEVTVKDMKVFEEVASKVQSLPEVEKDGVNYPKAEQSFMADAMKTLPWLGAILGTAMLVTSGILIYNAIRMTVLARRREIRIMQLVGATRFTVWAPMLIEGMVQGFLGGILAACVLWATSSLVQLTVVRNMDAFGRVQPFPVQQTLLVLGIAGAAYGLVCSMIAVREPLQVRRAA